jgi:cation:H+ antiporter
MSYRRIGVVLVVVALLAVALPVAPALAQGDEAGEAGEEGEEGEGGIEGAIEGFVEGQGLLGAILVLLVGVVLLTACVEKLISYLTRAALGLKMSLFALAIVFTGFEFDDTVLGLVLAAGGLEGAALGTALGTGLAIIGVTLALAAIVRPFPVDLPTDYIVLFALAPLILVPFVLVGTLTLVHGIVLLGFFVATFLYLIVREYQRGEPVFRSSELGEAIRPDGGVALPPSVSDIPEDRFVRGRNNAGVIWIGLAVVALVGIVFASMLLEAGSEVAVEGLGIEETVFGATVLTAILTFEDIMLTLEPVRRGVPEIGVGNVIGSVLFSVTGNVGIIMLVSDLEIGSAVLTFHLPAIIVVTALAAYFLYRGGLKRWHGAVLGGLYVVYWLVAIFVYGGVPLGG